MKLWIDDVRPAPEGYVWKKSVNEAKMFIQWVESARNPKFNLNNYPFDNITLIDAGDCIKFLDWLEETGRNYPIHIHSMNPVGIENMRRIIQRNGWKEV